MYNGALTLYKELFKILGGNREWVHYDQTFRAAGSIVANIAEGEGSERGKKGNTAMRYSNARGSLFETLAWLDIALVENMIPPEEAQKLKSKLEILGDALKESIESIDSSRYLGEDDAQERAKRETERIQGYLGGQK